MWFKFLLALFLAQFTLFAFADEFSACGEFHVQVPGESYLFAVPDESTEFLLDVKTQKLLDNSEKELLTIESRKRICISATVVNPRVWQLVGVQDLNPPEVEYPEVIPMNNIVPWDNGIVPVKFSAEINEEEKQMFKESCAEWERYANVTCLYVNDEFTESFVTVHKNLLGLNGCFATKGKDGSGLSDLIVNKINLGSDCWRKPIVIHEVGHTLGFSHAHQHPERDNYVVVDWEKTGTDRIAQLNHGKLDTFTRAFEPYDFFSIMHYPFMYEGEPALLSPQLEFAAYLNITGNFALWEATGSYLSAGDIINVQSLYGPRLAQ